MEGKLSFFPTTLFFLAQLGKGAGRRKEEKWKAYLFTPGTFTGPSATTTVRTYCSREGEKGHDHFSTHFSSPQKKNHADTLRRGGRSKKLFPSR